MIRRITQISQVIDVLDNPKATFFGGNNKDKDEYTREDIGKMNPTELNKLIRETLIVRITR